MSKVKKLFKSKPKAAPPPAPPVVIPQADTAEIERGRRRKIRITSTGSRSGTKLSDDEELLS